ncbi:unnamed protein product [Adineta ricciae]|uniref:Uncharacterized protein n=1 Tax=Adineta ricciae TaxID=249248 RepID=A0A814MZ39_ADIRI|nr:unnamed protein product [Adineta ricciae]
MTIGILIIYYKTPSLSIKICQLSFERKAKSEMQYNSRTRAVSVADFNKDNHLDLAVVNYGSDNIGIFFGKGDGTFENQITYSTTKGSLPYAITVFDFNSDTYLDIAIANFGINSISLLFGYSNMTFGYPIIYSLGSSRPIAISYGDFNNDLKIDLACVNYGTNDIGILLGNNDDGTFLSVLRYPTGYDSEPKSLAIADLNNDTYLDIIVANFGTNNIGIFYGYGNGNFAHMKIYSTGSYSKPYFVSVGDFNGDKQFDIAVINYALDNIGIFFGSSDNITFSNQIKLSTGQNSNPHSLVIADFNHDHFQDIAVANTGTDSIGLFFGWGNGSFTDQVTYTTGVNTGVQFINIGDFNEDTRIDIVVANNATNNVGVFLGIRTADFRSINTFPTNSGPYSLATGDLNHDGHSDIVVANYYAFTISIHFGNGDGSFTDYITYSTESESYPVDITLNDLNNDSNLDIIVVNYNQNNVGIFYGYGNGSVANQITISTGSQSYPNAARVGDFNNDKKLDIVTVNHGTYTISILLNYGNNSFSNPTTYNTQNEPISLAIGDFNNDNNSDIVVANLNSDSVSVYLGKGDGTFNEQRIFSTTENTLPIFVTVGDFNNDNKLDIITANYNRRTTALLLGNNDGTFQDPSLKWVGDTSQPTCLFVADFNNDSYLDVAVANYIGNNVLILIGLNGSFTGDSVYSTDASGPYYILADDFNEDGRLDLVTANPADDTIGIFFGYDAGKFQRINEFSTSYGSLPSSLTIGDFNNDNQADIAISNYGSNNFGVFFGYGNNTFTLDKIYFTNFQSQPIMIVSSDLNNDAILDLATVNVGSDSIGIFLGNRNGSFQNQKLFSTGSGSKPQSLSVADLNNDNQSDLVVANYGTNNIGILLRYNILSFTAMNFYPRSTTNTYRSITSADLNNDHQIDIVSANYYGNNIQIFFGHGDGLLTDPISYSTGSGSYPTSVAISDFNNDQHLDIVVTNFNTDNIGIFYNYGNGSFKNQLIYSTNSQSYPIFVTAGDFNRDNQSDIIVANYYAHNIGIFYNYGNGSFKNQIIYSTNTGSYPRCIAISDFNNDNYPDVVVANSGLNNIGIFLNNGNETFTDQITYSFSQGINPYFVNIGDFNHDNNMDIIACYLDTGYFAIYLGFGNGSFSKPKLRNAGSSTDYLSISVGDFNRDNRLDFAITNRYNNFVSFWLGYGNGEFSSPTRIYHSSFYNPNFVYATDLNNDGQLDVVIFDDYRIYTFLGLSTEGFLDVMTLSTGNGSLPQSVNVADFDNDGLNDIVVANFGLDNIGIFYGIGYGFFTNQTTYSTGDLSKPRSVAVGDVNNDNRIDIVIALYGTSNIGILLNNENGSFGPLITYLTELRFVPYSITVGDVNNDEQLDIITANYGSNSVILLFGKGNGTFVNQTEVFLGYGARPVFVTKHLINEKNDDNHEVSL